MFYCMQLWRTFGTDNVRVASIVPANSCSCCMVRFSGDRRIPWPDRRIPWPDVRGLCQLPERRAICRSTKLKCCDRVPDAVSSDATICVTRRGARVIRCSLPAERVTDVLWVFKTLSSSYISCLTRCDRTRSAHSMHCSLFATKTIVH